MQRADHYNPCKAVRRRPGLWDSLKERIQMRLMDHVATCPRCQKRLAMANRVQLAFDLIKSQPQSPDLLATANQKATGVLKHSLRTAPKSDMLRRSVQDQHWIDKKRSSFEWLLNAAACLCVMVMVRMGITDSLTDIRRQGETAVHNYYARNLDRQLVDEIFSDDPAAS